MLLNFATEKKPLPLRKGRKKDVEQNDPFMRTERSSARHNGGKQQPAPIYRGQSTDEPPLDRSGYGDLGLGLVRQASHEALDVNGGEADMRMRAAPRQDQPNNRSD